MSNIDIPDNYIKRITSTTPFGYTESEIKGWLQPIPNELESLEFISKMVVNEEISLRMAADWLEYKTGRSISARGLQKNIDKVYGKRQERLGATS